MIYGSYGGAPGVGDTSTAPTGALFAKLDAFEREGRTNTYYEDFKDFRIGAPGATEIYWANGWKTIGVATNGIFALIDAAGGGITFSTEAADNDYLHLAKVQCPFEINRTSQMLAFECRVKFASIADTKSDFFIGLGKSMTLTTAVPITTTAGDLATEDLVGFHRDATDGDEINTVCCSADASHTIIQNGVTTLVADTYVKLGFYWDPGIDNYLRFFVNGVEATTKYLMTTTASDVFPNNKRLGLLIGQTAAAASAGLTSVQWIKCSQLRASTA